jgi:hypothetical protein
MKLTNWQISSPQKQNIRKKRMKRFSGPDETMTDNLFEQCVSFWESVDNDVSDDVWHTSKAH